MFATLGVYSLSGSTIEVLVMYAIGVLGFFMRRFEFPIAPVILGVILGPVMETQFRRAMVASGGDAAVFVDRPLTVGLLGLALLALVLPYAPAIVGGCAGASPRRVASRSPTTTRPPVASWRVVAGATAVASAAADAAGIPAPSLFAGLLVGLGYAVATSSRLAPSRPAVLTAQALIGAVLGARLEPDTLGAAADRWAAVAVAVVGTVIASVLASRLITALTGLDHPTAPARPRAPARIESHTIRAQSSLRFKTAAEVVLRLGRRNRRRDGGLAVSDNGDLGTPRGDGCLMGGDRT